MKTNHIESNTIFRENVGLPIKKKDGRFANKNKTVSVSALKSAALKKKQRNKHTIKQTTTSKIRGNTTKSKSGHSDLVILAFKVH